MPESKPRLLIAEDEINIREALARHLASKYQVTTAIDGLAAIDLLKQKTFDVVLTDLRMPGADGQEVIAAATALTDPPVCIMLTAYGSTDNALLAGKTGAFDFISKPCNFRDLDEKLANAWQEKNKRSKTAPSADNGFSVTGRPGQNEIYLPENSSDPMYQLLEKAKRVAPGRATILLSGESGCGKEVLARFLHRESKRQGAFVAVHCAALSANLLESELFGHEKGAYTDADSRKIGRFEAADGGTLFLDEIGEIDAATQVKLLRVLESRSFERVGGSETITVDVRLLAATNRDLKKMVEAKTFREDLYYRLSVVNLIIPPLRERKMEITRLAQLFLKEFNRENDRNVAGFTPEAMELLNNYNWPGNIRQLRNTIESMVVLAGDSMLDVADLPPEIASAEISHASEAQGTLKNAEQQEIIKALDKCSGNITKAAELLGISRRTLHRRLNDYKQKDEN